MTEYSRSVRKDSHTAQQVDALFASLTSGILGVSNGDSNLQKRVRCISETIGCESVEPCCTCSSTNVCLELYFAKWKSSWLQPVYTVKSVIGRSD